MDDDDDDIYAPDETTGVDRALLQSTLPNATIKDEDMGNAPAGTDNEDEEEEEDEDSDIEIVTERKDGTKPEPPQAARANNIKTVPARIDSPGVTGRVQPSRSPLLKVEAPSASSPQPARPGVLYPAFKTSNIDIDANPVYEPVSKPIKGLDMDNDFSEDDKPWRRPGTDMTDYFNYGFDEFTWALYCEKQKTISAENAAIKKQFDELNPATANAGVQMPPGAGVMPGMPNLQSDLMAQMAQGLMAQGMDPSSMTFDQFQQYAAGFGQTGMGGAGYGLQGQGQQQMGGYAGGYDGGHGSWNQGSRGGRRR